jgi:hypothetical protein
VDPDAYERGRIKLIAPNGKTKSVSPGSNRPFDYEAWLNRNGGRDGARLEVWHGSFEKWEAAVTETERALRDDISRRQKAISRLRRTNDEDGQDEPSRLDQWLIAQGRLRAGLFGLEPISNEGAGDQGASSDEIFEAADVWPSIIGQVQGERDSAETKTVQAEGVVSEDQTMPTFTAYTEPADREPVAGEPFEQDGQLNPPAREMQQERAGSPDPPLAHLPETTAPIPTRNGLHSAGSPFTSKLHRKAAICRQASSGRYSFSHLEMEFWFGKRLLRKLSDGRVATIECTRPINAWLSGE